MSEQPENTQATEAPQEEKVRKIRVGNMEIAIESITDEEAAHRRWDKFEKRFSKERRIMVNVRNSRLQTKINMILFGKLGNYDEKNWDIYCPDGDRTIAYYISERIESGDETPVMYIIGVSDDVSEETFNEVRRKINKIKLTS